MEEQVLSIESEIWKKIDGYNNYEISNLGRVRAINYTPYKILKQYLKPDGYYNVILWKNNKMKNFKVHRLIAAAFIPNPNNYPVINHINEIKTDNRIENLEWCTQKHNCNHGTRNQKVSENNGVNRKVYQIDFNGNIINTYYNVNEAAKQTGINNSLIAQCCRNEKSHGGMYLWSYEEDLDKIQEKVSKNFAKFIALNDTDYISIKEFSAITGINQMSIRTRLRRNKSINDYIDKYYEITGSEH